MRTNCCERYREYASLELDGQLSAFEAALLDHHLERCPSCSAFAADVARTTELLRHAELDPLGAPVVLPAPAHTRRAAFATTAVAAAVAAAAAALYTVTTLSPKAQPSAAKAVAGSTLLKEPYLAYPTPHKSIQVPRIRTVPASLLDGPVRGVHGITADTGRPTV